MDNSNEFIKKNLMNFYTRVLLKHNITSIEQLNHAVESGQINIDEFVIDLDKIISPEKQKEVLEQNPDYVEVQGAKTPVKYDYDPATKEFSANVNVLLKDLHKLTNLPTLPSGRTITVRVSRTENGSILFTGKNLEELKQKVAEFV